MSKEVVAEVIALIELGFIAPEDIVKCLRKANSEPEKALAEQPAPVQEPWKYRRWNDEAEKWELTDDCGWPSKPLYTTPPAVKEKNT